MSAVGKPSRGVEALRAGQALRHWLLQGPAQLRAGTQRGGVAGEVDGAGQARYVYAEITGYYLHWLSGLPATGATATHGGLAGNARAALAWLVRSHMGPVLPPTRIHLAPETGPADWRNTTHFCFDLAMLAGGLARAERAGLIEVPTMLWDALGAALDGFVDAGVLRALPPGADLQRVPRRWSTLGGAFLAKAGSRIDFVPAHAGFRPALRLAAQATRDRVAGRAAQSPVEMLHPTLYAMEGALCSPDADWRAIADWLARLLAFDPGNGELPEAPDSAVPRSDVLAQALRLALLLRARATPGAPDASCIDRLAGALLARVRGDGSIAFRPGHPAGPANVWCAMFAEQALRWYASDASPAQGALAPEHLV